MTRDAREGTGDDGRTRDDAATQDKGPISTGTPAPAGGAALANPSLPYEPTRPMTAPDADAPVRPGYLQQVIRDSLALPRAKVGAAWIGLVMFFACFAPYIASSHPILLKADGAWTTPLLRHLDPVDVALPVAFVTATVLLVRRRLPAGEGLALAFWAGALVYAVGSAYSIPKYWKSLRFEGYGRELLSAPSATALMVLYAVIVLAAVVLPPLLWVRPRAVRITTVCLAPLLLLMVLFPLRPPASVVYDQYRTMQKQGRAEAVIRTVVPYSPLDRQSELRLMPPNAKNWAGTDSYGADLLSRMIHASRIALAIGFIATGISVVLGIIFGGIMGYFAGTVDLIGMRLIEILEAIPTLVLLIAITAAWGRNLYLMMAVIGLLRWTGDARFIRAEFLKLRKQDFVQAAIATGLPLRSILFRHMLPNGISPVLVSASFGVASAILLESTLSFLGLGLVDEPSWGEMLNQARSGGAGFNWWIATFPGALIFLTVFSYNLVGEAIRDALDPKLLKRE